MRKKIIFLFLAALLFSIVGCARLGEYYTDAKIGQQREDVQAFQEATRTVAEPLVGTPWAEIIAGLLGIGLGGVLVHKEKKK